MTQTLKICPTCDGTGHPEPGADCDDCTCACCGLATGKTLKTNDGVHGAGHSDPICPDCYEKLIPCAKCEVRVPEVELVYPQECSATYWSPAEYSSEGYCAACMDTLAEEDAREPDPDRERD